MGHGIAHALTGVRLWYGACNLEECGPKFPQQFGPTEGVNTTMSFLWMIIIGLILGSVAKVLMPESSRGGLTGTLVIGTGGSVLAGVLGGAEHWYAPGEPVSLLASVAGAIILLALYRASIPREPRASRNLRNAA